MWPQAHGYYKQDNSLTDCDNSKPRYKHISEERYLYAISNGWATSPHNCEETSQVWWYYSNQAVESPDKVAAGMWWAITSLHSVGQASLTVISETCRKILPFCLLVYTYVILVGKMKTRIVIVTVGILSVYIFCCGSQLKYVRYRGLSMCVIIN